MIHSLLKVNIALYKEAIRVIIYISAGHVVAQFVEALRYKPEGRGFDSLWCHWNYSLT